MTKYFVAAIAVLGLANFAFANESELQTSEIQIETGVEAENADWDILRNQRYVFVGSFSCSNPFKWDTDTVESRRRMRASAMILELDRGANVEIRDIVVRCRNGRICDRIEGGELGNRPVRVRFNRRGLEVQSIQFRAKPKGLPPSKVNVYLENRNSGW